MIDYYMVCSGINNELLLLLTLDYFDLVILFFLD